MFQRIPDPYTRDAGLATDEVAVADSDHPDRTVVGLRLTLLFDDKEIACGCLYGIPEAGASTCAYANVRATRSLCAQVFEHSPNVRAATP